MYGHLNDAELHRALRVNAETINRLQDTNQAIRMEIKRRDDERQDKLFEVGQ